MNNENKIKNTTENKGKWSSSLQMFKQLPFVYFIGFLALIYIANAHNAERKMRKIAVDKKELKELRWKYISATASLKYSSTASYIEHRVSPSEIELNRDPLVVINLEE